MELSLLEHSPRLRSIYTQLCFCYPLGDNASHAAVIDKLEDGLTKLTDSFPWVAGQVVNGEDTGIFKVVPFEERPRLTTKDFTTVDLWPTMEEFRKARFPFSMLDEKDLCPRTTLGGGSGETATDPAPVLLMQANFVKGGLLLTVQVSHCTMDVVGQVHMIRLLSKVCRNEDFTDDEIKNGNLDRANIIPVLEGVDLADHHSREEKEKDELASSCKDGASSASDQSVSASSQSLTWAYFIFTASSLITLKESVSRCLPNNPVPSSNKASPSFISTDDAISALIWQSIARARAHRLPDLESTKTTFTRQVDMRTKLSIPRTYPGNVVTNTSSTTTLQNLIQKPTGEVAFELRSLLDPQDLNRTIRARATAQREALSTPAGTETKLKREPNKDRSTNIVVSSWSKTDCFTDMDFGLDLGPHGDHRYDEQGRQKGPEAVRRPRFEPLEGIVYLLPRTPDGEIVAGICLREDDMGVLRKDVDGLAGFAEYIG